MEAGLVSGHDFSRADKTNKNDRALAPEGSFLRTHPDPALFPHPAHPMHETRNRTPSLTPHAKTEWKRALYQGTTSVVPKKPIKMTGL
jgi:hypothetical protein